MALHMKPHGKGIHHTEIRHHCKILSLPPPPPPPPPPNSSGTTPHKPLFQSSLSSSVRLLTSELKRQAKVEKSGRRELREAVQYLFKCTHLHTLHTSSKNGLMDILGYYTIYWRHNTLLLQCIVVIVIMLSPTPSFTPPIDDHNS